MTTQVRYNLIVHSHVFTNLPDQGKLFKRFVTKGNLKLYLLDAYVNYNRHNRVSSDCNKHGKRKCFMERSRPE